MDSYNRKRNHTYISIDLDRTDAVLASIALSCHKAGRKVKNALISTQTPKERTAVVPRQNLEQCQSKTIWKSLGNFPNLVGLTIDLNHCNLRASTLAVVLGATKSLKELTLRNLLLTGNLCDQNALQRIMASLSNLHCLAVERCHGTAVIRTLLTNTTCLRKVKIGSSRISQSDDFASVTLVDMCCANPRLRSLSLCDVSDLEDQHVCYLMEALTSQDLARRLHELHISSSIAGEVAGEAVLQFLLESNAYISSLVLDLGGAWGTAGASLTRVLAEKTALRKLNIRICGGEGRVGTDADGVSNATTIAAALPTSELTHLELSVDFGRTSSSFRGFQEVSEAFEVALERNHRLEHLQLSERSPPRAIQTMNTAFMNMKIDLNRSGLLCLLHRAQEERSISTDLYLEGMARANDNLSVLFYALQNNPALFW